MKAIVIGASGGIGGALAGALGARGDQVTGLSRRSVPAIELEDERSIGAAAAGLSGKGPFDLLAVASGLLHGDGIEPEKAIRMTSQQAFDHYFRVNATGPALVVRDFLPLMRTDGRAVIAILSARVGSIGDNRLGGWVGYRASKAALNQIIRTFSIELARTRPGLILVGFHPGTVDTGLSAPFQRNLPDGQLLTPTQSARALIGVIDALTPADSGACLDWKGHPVPA